MIPKISIIVPSYNGEKYIDKVLACLTNQDCTDYEIIVIDDGSTDNSPKRCDEWATKFDYIKIIHQNNKGLSGARNTGIKFAKGEYILFVDVDDTVSNTTINNLLSIIEKKSPDLVMFGFYYCDEETNIIKKNGLDESFYGDNKTFFSNQFIPTIDNEFFNAPWNKLIKRSILINHNLFFDETCSIYEDLIFAPRLLNICKNIYLSTEINYYYHLRNSGNLLSGFYPDCYDSLLKFYSGAIDYCNNYDNNEAQVLRINRKFIESVLSFIKKIVHTKSIGFSQKRMLILSIANDSHFINASKKSSLPIGRKLMCFILTHKLILLCFILYKIKGY